MGATVIIVGTSVLVLLLAGYLAQIYLPPPKPKIVGIDLGTTYSCIGIYHAVSGLAEVLEAEKGKQCIPSVVAFSSDGVVVGYKAFAQADQNPSNTIYDAKRFIGKIFSAEELRNLQLQYSFKLFLDKRGMVQFGVATGNKTLLIRPEEVGSIIIDHLKKVAEKRLSIPVKRVVLSVPAEFDILQRNYTAKAATIAGLQVMRIINEPTAAALAYGLHKHPSLRSIMVIDLGGGTLDVSILSVQGGMFFAQAMAGNNYLGGQDFNQRVVLHFQDLLSRYHGIQTFDSEDMQNIRLLTEEMKLNLTTQTSSQASVRLKSLPKNITLTLTRSEFEHLNADLFKKVLEPIKIALESIDVDKSEIDEIVLVGGSTRIPKVRDIIRKFFHKNPNTSIDPEIAVAIGVSVQAGILGGMWPLTVSAIEIPTQVKKIHIS